MAMMIAKFHRLIQSRLLWIIFLVVIVFSFVIWGMQPPNKTRDQAQAAPGTLNGKPVPPEEFRKAYRHEYITLILMVGPRLRHTDEIDDYLREAAWHRLIGWREANRQGFEVNDREILDAIRKEPSFQTKGVFHIEKYRNFLGSTLQPIGLNERSFEEYLRGELLTRKLANMIRMATVVSPAEQEAARIRQTETFQASYVAIDADKVAASISVTNEAARRHFEQNPEAYRMPPRVQLRFVRFDAHRHLDDIRPFSEQAIQDYYSLNARQFQREKSVSENPEDSASSRSVLPELSEIREEVVQRMRKDTAMTRARNEADRFVQAIAPYATSKPLSFEEAAARETIPVEVTAPFARGQAIPSIDAPLRASEIAFELQPTPDEYFSEPISGESCVYVFALDKRLPAFIPDFETVREEALETVRTEQIAKAQRKMAHEIYRRIHEGESLSAVASEYKLEVVEMEPFSLASRPRDPHSRPLLSILPGLNEGEVTRPVETADGTFLIAKLNERIRRKPDAPPPPLEQNPPSMRAKKATRVFHSWIQSLLEQNDFQERPRPSSDLSNASPGG